MSALTAILTQATQHNTRVRMHHSTFPHLREEMRDGAVELRGIELEWGEYPAPGFAILQDSQGQPYQIMSAGLIA
jgi:hypothetical protein